MLWSVRLSKRFRDGLLAILGVAALSLAAFFALHEPLGRPVRLQMTAGQEGGTRHRIAQALQREAAQRAIAIELQAMAGSEAAIQAVESGLVDAAFVQGGLDMIDHPGIRQVAVLHVEPLHLLVKELMSGFLAHASDARDFLMRLILHQRDNLEDQARAQHRPAEVLWNEAVGERTHMALEAGVVDGRDFVPGQNRPVA
jgi:hypothetical protein